MIEKLNRKYVLSNINDAIGLFAKQEKKGY
jgi:hypothetical protein